MFLEIFKRSTFTDELKMMTNFRIKVICLDLKDRGAILSVGHFSYAVYWMSQTANFIMSSYYMKDLPAWVKAFNAKKYYINYICLGWSLMKDPEAYDEKLTG
ncbi:MAG: hypothetical protein ACMUEM_07840 [Flavobacteriales bacterium AspAUS03]